MSNDATPGDASPGLDQPVTSPPSKLETLRTALAYFLEDDNMIDRYEADGLKTLILQDGQFHQEEKAFLQEAITHNNFDEQAITLLKDLLHRYSGSGS